MTGRKWIHPAWKTLGIDPTSDQRAIRVAYTAMLKSIDPETDPKAFIELREAFEAAKVQAQWVDLQDDDEAEVEEDDYDWDEDEKDAQDWALSGDLYQIRPSLHVANRHNDPGDPAWEAPAPPEAAEPAPPPPEEPARRSPWAGVTAEQADAHSRALATMLYSQDHGAQPWPTAEQEEKMLAHWRGIVADPRMQEVSYFADAERWFSELIARTAAFSDPLVLPVTEFFGWLGSDGAITQTPAIAYLTRRYRMLEFQRDVKQPRHPLNAAWRELVQPAGANPRRGRVGKDKVLQLLRTVRTHFPDLEGCFDAERVALWDGSHIGTGTGSGGDWSTVAWIIGILLFAAIRLFASFSSSDSSPRPSGYPPVVVPDNSIYFPPANEPMPAIQPAVPPPQAFEPGESGTPSAIIFDGTLEHSDADLDQALQSLFGDTLDIATIGQRKPALYEALQAFWAREKANRVRKLKFAEHLSDFLARRYPRGIHKQEPALFTR